MNQNIRVDSTTGTDLHGDELVPAVLISNMLQRGKLPSTHAAGANVPSLARFDYIVQRAHDLFLRHRLVKTVNLEHVHVFDPQTLQTTIDGVEDVLSGKAVLIDRVWVVLVFVLPLHDAEEALG